MPLTLIVNARLPRLLAFILCYALMMSMLAPFGIRRAAAVSAHKTNPNAKGEAPSLKPTGQGAGRRDGELLVRFRAGISEQDKSGLALARDPPQITIAR